MTDRTCSLPECEKPHRARGFCSTHYNVIVSGERKRHPRETRSCVVCGTRVTRRRDNAHQPTCSVTCRRVVQWGHDLAPVSDYEWAADAVKRARNAGAVIVEQFDRLTIFERDHWTCQACDVHCSDPDPFTLGAATVDHVVPLHLGGEHSTRNSQTLCLSCNSAKQARISDVA